MDGFGDGNNVTIRISGTSAEAVAAIAQVNESLAQLIARSREASDAAGMVGNTLGSGSGFGGGVTSMLSAFGSGLSTVVGHMANFVSGWAQMQLALLGNEAFNAAASAIHNFAEEIWNLSNATEKNVYSWRYTYATTDPATGKQMTPAAAMANAQAIAAWGQSFARDIPFTEQDLMTSISGAAPLGLDLKGLQKYYPMIADLAATHINPMTGQPLDLGQAVMAIRGEMMGYSRMLKYQLNINPEELVPYGLAFQGRGIGGHITDMTTLLPALQAYSEHQGWTQMQGGTDKGAAFTTAHSTWWGELSSFTDRLNALQLMLGGTDPRNMTQYKGGFFGQIKKDLEDISAWWDAHQQGIFDMGRVFGDLFGAGAHGGTFVLQGIFQGLAGGGIGTGILDNVKKLTDWFDDPKHQQDLKDIGTLIGTNLGDAAKKAGDAFGTLADGMDRVSRATGGSGKSDVFQFFVDIFTFFPAQIGRGLKVAGDLMMLIRDMKDGNVDAFADDLVNLASDGAEVASLGAFKGWTAPMKGSAKEGIWGFASDFIGVIELMGEATHGFIVLLGDLGEALHDAFTFNFDALGGDMQRLQNDWAAMTQDMAKNIANIQYQMQQTHDTGGDWGGEGRSLPSIPGFQPTGAGRAPGPHGQYISGLGGTPGSLLGGMGPVSWVGGGASGFQQGQAWVQQIMAGVNAARMQVHSAGQQIGDEIAHAVAQGLARSSASAGGSGIGASIANIVRAEIARAEQSLAATPGAYFSRGTYGGQY